MANHGAAALLIASLLVAVALADARLTVQRDMYGGSTHMPMNSIQSARICMTAIASICNKVRGVQVAESCLSVAKSAGLTEEQFLGFNPNINCDKVFVGQWVCLDATAA